MSSASSSIKPAGSDPFAGLGETTNAPLAPLPEDERVLLQALSGFKQTARKAAAANPFAAAAQPDLDLLSSAKPAASAVQRNSVSTMPGWDDRIHFHWSVEQIQIVEPNPFDAPDVQEAFEALKKADGQLRAKK